MPASDVVVLVMFIMAYLAVWAGLAVVVGRQVVARYERGDSLRTLWIAAVVISPILGAVAWLLWTAVSDRPHSPSYR
ncbi:hypothetical protein [Microbacterium sp.]|uniref:hypothetical protein n=1 Tax=Microbacterium sp. TaxID=51671 RepID=UPI0039E6C319